MANIDIGAYNSGGYTIGAFQFESAVIYYETLVSSFAFTDSLIGYQNYKDVLNSIFSLTSSIVDNLVYSENLESVFTFTGNPPIGTVTSALDIGAYNTTGSSIGAFQPSVLVQTYYDHQHYVDNILTDITTLWEIIDKANYLESLESLLDFTSSINDRLKYIRINISEPNRLRIEINMPDRLKQNIFMPDRMRINLKSRR